jgi:hypothetical protein
MLMHGGVFMGNRVLPEEWVKDAFVTRAVVPEINGSFNYGYHLWVSREGGELLFNGMLGQNIWLCPRNDLMVVMTGGNNEIFQASPALEIVRGYLGGDIFDSSRRRDFELLREKEARFFSSRSWVKEHRHRGLLLPMRGHIDFSWYSIIGRYAVSKNRAGVLPLILRAMQNNFESGIEEISIRKIGRDLWLYYVESGREYKLKLGLGRYESNRVETRGEIYLVMAAAEATWNRQGQREYRIELLLPETANVRRIRIGKVRNGVIKIDLSETPNNRLLETMLKSYSESYPKLGMGFDILDKRFGRGAISDGLRNSFNPTLLGVDLRNDGYTDILDEENKKISEAEKRTKPIKSILDKFFSEKKKD